MKTLKRVLSYIGVSSIIWVILSLIMALVSAVTALLIPMQLGKVIDYISEYCKPYMDFFNIHLFTNILIKTALLVLICAVCQQLMSIINNKVTYTVVKNVRYEIFKKLQRLPLKVLDSQSTGAIVSKMINDVETFADGLLLGFSQVFTGLVTIVGTLILMLFINVKVALVVTVLTPISIFVAKFIASRTHDMFKKQSETRAEQTALIDELLTNEKVVKCFAYEAESLEKFDEINERLKECSLKATFYSSLTNPCTRFVNSFVYAAVVLVGGLLVLAGGLTVGMLSTLLCYANQYTKPFNEISGVIAELQNAIACAERIFELLDEKDEENSKVLDEYIAGDTKVDNVGMVVFDKVDFSYSEDKTLIDNLNLTILPGMNVAIVGPTGCGKTTLINLLMRFYDVNSGSIMVDGVDVREMRRHTLRGKFGMVLQDTWINEGTVLDNILIGRPEATREEAIEAAKKVHAHSFIKRMSDGYDTVLSENGEGLSVGQKQLLCITRVMLMQPDILILDEATSNIDTRTEMLISKAFDELMKDRTSFVVAHRLSTIKNADIILVMKDGHIIEQGKHEELLAAKGFYSELYNSQYEGI